MSIPASASETQIATTTASASETATATAPATSTNINAFETKVDGNNEAEGSLNNASENGGNAESDSNDEAEDAQDKYALNYALGMKKMKLALSLIEQKADVNYIQSAGLGFGEFEQSIIKCMRSFIANYDFPDKPLCFSVLKSLLEASADPNTFGTNRDNTSGFTALNFALRITDSKERSAVIDLLIEHKADPILETFPDLGTTPILDAISLGHNAIAEEWCDTHIGKANDKMSEVAQNIFGLFSAVGNTLALEKGFDNQKISRDRLQEAFMYLGQKFIPDVELYCDKGNMRHACGPIGMGRSYADNPKIAETLWKSIIALHEKNYNEFLNNKLSGIDLSFVFIGKTKALLKELTNTIKWYLKYIDCSDLDKYNREVGSFHILNFDIQARLLHATLNSESNDANANLYKSAYALIGCLLQEEFIRQGYFEILKQHIKLKEQGQENEVDTFIFLDEKEKIERFLELWKESKGKKDVTLDSEWMEYAKATIHKCLRPKTLAFVYRTMKFKTPANERFKFNQLPASLQTHIMSYAEESPHKVEFQDPSMMTLFARNRLALVKAKQDKQDNLPKSCSSS